MKILNQRKPQAMRFTKHFPVPFTRKLATQNSSSIAIWFQSTGLLVRSFGFAGPSPRRECVVRRSSRPSGVAIERRHRRRAGQGLPYSLLGDHYFARTTICIHLKCAITVPASRCLTVASRSCVVRPRRQASARASVGASRARPSYTAGEAREIHQPSGAPGC